MWEGGVAVGGEAGVMGKAGVLVQYCHELWVGKGGVS